MTISPADLAAVLAKHLDWLRGKSDGVRANLYGADLYGANLSGANLSRADLYGADLYGARLYGANLSGARLPSPTVVLLAMWLTVSDPLCADLMRFDASCHPDPSAFDRWADAAEGPCPYAGVTVERAANFTEKRALWAPGPSERPYDLMVRVLAEKCPPWSDEQRSAFLATFAKAAT